MINTVTIVGRMTKDPELTYTPSGVAMTRFTLAANRPFKNAAGENEADFINCVAWRKQAENMANFLRKGSLTGVVGRIQTSNFEGKDGNRIFMTEVVADSVQFLEPKNSGGGQSNSAQQSGNTNTPNTQQGMSQGQADAFAGQVGAIDDDSLPF